MTKVPQQITYREVDTENMDAVDTVVVDVDAVADVEDMTVVEVVEIAGAGSPAIIVVRPSTSLDTVSNQAVEHIVTAIIQQRQ